MSELYSLQGYLFLGERLPSGRPGRMKWAGNLESAQLELTTEKRTKNESFSGGRGLYGSGTTRKSGRLTGSFDEWLNNVLALGWQGEPLAVSTGSVTDEPLPPDLEIGEFFALAHPYASALAIEDSTGSPVTVPSSAYELIGHNERTYEVVSALSGYTEPLLASYTYAAYEDLEVFSEEAREIYGIFDGINTETGRGIVFDFYKMKFDPFASTELLHEEYGALPFGADILVDPLNFNSSGKGGYYKMRRKAAA